MPELLGVLVPVPDLVPPVDGRVHQLHPLLYCILLEGTLCVNHSITKLLLTRGEPNRQNLQFFVSSTCNIQGHNNRNRENYLKSTFCHRQTEPSLVMKSL